jgi:hypothetical protein
VCLDDALHLIPIEALIVGSGMLGEQCQVHVEASFARLVGAHAATTNEGTLLAIGGADYDAKTESATASGATSFAPPIDEPFATQRSFGAEGGWPDLPGARSEAQAVASLYRSVFNRGALVLDGDKATKSAFIRESPGARFGSLKRTAVGP